MTELKPQDLAQVGGGLFASRALKRFWVRPVPAPVGLPVRPTRELAV